MTTDTSAFTFNKRNNGLYVCEFGNDRTLAISTVNNNESKFTKREVLQTQAARALQKRMGYPPDVKLIRALQLGTIQNSNVLPADINRAMQIYGPSIPALRGRTTTQKSLPFPPESTRERALDAQSMYIDHFRAQGRDFFLTYTKPINHLVVSPVPKANLLTLRRTLRIHLGVYGQRKIRVAHIYSDNGKGIVEMTNDFAGAGITTHFAGPDMHVHTIER